MNKTNFALMAALYDTPGAGLYQDIYMPMMKYSLATIHSMQTNSEMYYDVGNLQLVIETKFGITIPLVVLKQCVKYFVRNQTEEINIKDYENGDKFLIRKDWDVTLDNSLEDKLSILESSFDKIEEGFKHYCDSLGMITTKTFLEFVKDNAIDIYKCFEDGGVSVKVNEEYVNVVSFLKVLEKNDRSTFNIANNIFWGSVIAGFLQRERDMNIVPNDKIDYYLDTSLVMAAIDLASEENVSYAREMIGIMTSAGATIRIHSLTFKEIISILFSVERDQKPRPNSSIESAYDRRQLTPTIILGIRSNLRKIIEDTGIIVDKDISDKEYNEIIAKYKNNPKVKDLSNLRGWNGIDRHDVDFAAIHDIYLTDIILKKRGNIQSAEKVNCSFVSLNVDLISFVKEKYRENRIPLVFHPSKTISDLWIHNTKCKNIQNIALPEAMSRCIALNNTDVRRKLRIVAKYQNGNSFTNKEYQDIELALITRSAGVLAEIETLQSIDSKNTNAIKDQLLIICRTAIKEETEKRALLASIEHTTLTAQKESKQIVEDKEKEILAKNEQIDKLSRIVILGDEIRDFEARIRQLETKRNKSVSFAKYWICICGEYFGLLLLVFGIAYMFYQQEFNKIIQYISPTIGVVIFAICSHFRNFYFLSPIISKKKIKDEQLVFWDSKNPEYQECKSNISSLLAEKERLNSEAHT